MAHGSESFLVLRLGLMAGSQLFPEQLQELRDALLCCLLLIKLGPSLMILRWLAMLYFMHPLVDFLNASMEGRAAQELFTVSIERTIVYWKGLYKPLLPPFSESHVSNFVRLQDASCLPPEPTTSSYFQVIPIGCVVCIECHSTSQRTRLLGAHIQLSSI